jgi:hypothetical protein
MDNRAMRALSAVILLPVLAWLGIGLYHWTRGTHWLIPAFVVWAALFALVASYTLFHAVTGRGERIDRGSDASNRKSAPLPPR